MFRAGRRSLFRGILVISFLAILAGVMPLSDLAPGQAAVAAAAAPAAPAVPGAPGAPTKYPITILDATGAKVTLQREPARIVSLAPSNTEILFRVGLGHKLVGVTSACDYPDDAKKIAKIGDYTINIEAVLASRPDLVVAVADLQSAEIKKLRELKVPVLAVNPQTIDEVLDAIVMIGEAGGAASYSREVADGLRARIRRVEQAVASVPEGARPYVFVEIWNDPLMTAGAGTFVDDLTTRAGGRNIASSISGWPQISLETVLAARPEVIILTSYNKAEVLTRREWRKVPAIVSGRVYEVNPDTLVRPGPRLVDGLETLVGLFHGDILRTGR